MKKRIGLLALIGILVLGSLFFLTGEKSLIKAQTAANTGPQLFKTYCQPCHGELGKGDGQLAYLLYPKPRDFTKGVFKLRSTPSGQIPTDQDLMRTIRAGMPGTAMPSFYYLPDDQIKLLVEYIKQLGQLQGKSSTPIQVSNPPDPSNELVDKGREAYTQLGCNQCHGTLGKGDGPVAAELKDDWGFPIRVRDFTQGTYLGGGDPKDLYLRFMTGLNGTPMPAYGDTISYLAPNQQDRDKLTWGLVYYVKSLETIQARQNKPQPPKDGIIQVAKVEDSKKEIDLLNLHNPEWNSTPSVSVPLSRLWQKDNSNFSTVRVKARSNQDYIALMLEWEDTSQDAGSYAIQDFQDAAAVQFPLKGKQTFQGMGQKDAPCNIWFWRSEWQMRKDRKAKSDIKAKYGNRASDTADAVPSEIEEEANLPGRDAGNPVSLQQIASAVEDIDAAGPGTLTSQPPDQQNVMGKGEWDGKTWRVVFVRKLNAKDSGDVRFRVSKPTPVAFAVWNGSERDRNGQKLVSTWYSLQFQQ